MPAYDYALVRAVDVATGDAETVGVVVSSRQARLLGVRLAARARVEGASGRLGLDAELLARALRAFAAVAEGGAGPLGRLPPSERFHFLTATRSTALQTSPVRTGWEADPAAALDRIAASLGLRETSDGGTRPGSAGV